MRASSHKLFNTTIGINVFLAYYQQYLIEVSLVALGLFLFSSFPDKIERFGLRHRGRSHSIVIYTLAAIICFIGLNLIPSLYWGWWLILGAIAGCIGHIIGDMFSKRGIQVMGIPIRFGLYSTGSKSEYIFLWSCIILSLLFLR